MAIHLPTYKSCALNAINNVKPKRFYTRQFDPAVRMALSLFTEKKAGQKLFSLYQHENKFIIVYKIRGVKKYCTFFTRFVTKLHVGKMCFAPFGDSGRKIADFLEFPIVL